MECCKSTGKGKTNSKKLFAGTLCFERGEDGDKISVKYAEVIYGQGYANLYNNVGVYEVSVKTGLKWCYADELDIMEIP